MLAVVMDTQSTLRTINDDDHSILCSKFHFIFENSQGQQYGHCHPRFVHQFYPNPEIILNSMKNDEIIMIRLCVTNFTWKFVSNIPEESLIKLLEPITSKMPQSSFVVISTDKLPLSLNQVGFEQGPFFSSPIKFTKGNLSDQGLKHLNQKIQPLLLFFIDGASVIDDSDEKWQVTYLQDENFNILAYCTLYPFLSFPDKIRLRISQFIVIPPFQRRGLGSLLYRKVLDDVCNNDLITQVTVEDPSIEFLDFRLINDLSLIKTHPNLYSKLEPLEANEVDLLEKFSTISNRSEDETWVEFRLQVKRFLLKKFKEDIPTHDSEQKKIVLQNLFEEEIQRFKKLTTRYH